MIEVAVMLYIFNLNEQLQAVLKNDGTACPYYDAIHTEKLNGENTFTFTVPADHLDSQYVTEGNLVAFQDLDLNWQLFEIKRVTDIHGDGLTRTAFCEHALYELIDDFIEDVRPTDCSAHFALTQALSGTRWQPGTVDNLGQNSTNFYYESALSAVQKVVNTWKGELQFRVIVEGGTISARYVDLLARRGADTGKQFVYSKDIKSIEREVDLTETKTALYGRGKGVEVGEGYGRRLDFADVVWTSPPDPVDKPAGQEWVEDPEALARWGRPGGRHRFGTYDDPEETDAARLLQKTWEALQERKNPRITYRLDVADLERLSGYEHEKVRLGDTVRVIDRAFSPALLVEARVIEINRDLLRPENTRITLGNFAPTIADENLKVQETVQVVRDRQGVWDNAAPFTGPVPTDWLTGIIDTLNNEVKAGNGSVTLTDNNGILIVDNPAAPTKALRLLGGLLAISNEKDPVTGEWVWRTFGTGDGFTADLLNAGQIRTSLVQILGNSNFYWDGDYLYIINPDDQNQQIRLSKEGIRFTKDGGQTWQVAIDFDGIRMEGQSADGYTHYTGDGVKVYDEEENLVAHLGSFETENDQTATFDRNSVAYDEDGQQVAVDVPRFGTGAFGDPDGAVLVEEGTTNVFTNSGFESGDTTGWGSHAYSGTGTWSVGSGYKRSGSYGARIDGGSNGFFIYQSPGTNDQVYSISFKVKREDGAVLTTSHVQAVCNNAVVAFDSITAIGDGWYICEKNNVTRTTGTWGIKVAVGVIIYVDECQMENKAYSTSYHGSTRSPETLTIPGSVLNPQEGTIEFRVKVPIVANYNNFFSMATSNGRFLLFFNSLGRAFFDYGAANSGIGTPNGIITANNYYAIALRWSASLNKLSLFVNGVHYTKDLPNGVASSFPATVSIVNNYSAWIDDLRFSSKYRTDEEILAAYQSGQPLPVDEWTTCKMSFDGNLKPTVRRFGLWSKNSEISLLAPPVEGGIRVYDASGNLRTHIGQYAAGKYGAKVINGEIYSTLFKTGDESSTDYIKLAPGNEPLSVVKNNKSALEIWTFDNGGSIVFSDTSVNDIRGMITVYDDMLGDGLRVIGRSGSGGYNKDVIVEGAFIRLYAPDVMIGDGSTPGTTVWGDLYVSGGLNVSGLPKNAIEETSQGKVALAARESPDVRYIDEGKAQLVNGECKIEIDPILLECIVPNSDKTPWLVHLTPTVAETLYVAEMSDTYFLVKSTDITSNAIFFWSLSAIRKGFTDARFQKDRFVEEDVLTSNWEDELGVIIDEEPESGMG